MLSKRKDRIFHINDGKVQRFHDLAMVETLQQDRTLISINRAQPAALPIIVTELERHPLGTQAFVPMRGGLCRGGRGRRR
jgi:ureidoglycolate lyase